MCPGIGSVKGPSYTKKMQSCTKCHQDIVSYALQEPFKKEKTTRTAGTDATRVDETAE